MTKYVTGSAGRVDGFLLACNLSLVLEDRTLDALVYRPTPVPPTTQVASR